MLDQNTDRMWYVIGAVIIGAAIILILNNTFPQLFASVGGTFQDKTEQVTKEVDNLTLTDGTMPKSRNLLSLSDVAARVITDDVENGFGKIYAGSTYGYDFQGESNMTYTLSTDISSRQVDFEDYSYEYDLFITTPDFDKPSSIKNGVAINEPRTIVTGDSGVLTIWFRLPSVHENRTIYKQVLDGDYRVQLEKGDKATDYVAH